MKRAVGFVIHVLAALGAVALIGMFSSMLKKHYETVCVENNADDYGFTVPQIKAGVSRSRVIYGDHYE